MNEILQAMKTRRSIRKFKPDMPRKEDIDQIIEAGLYAASGMGRQSSIIVAVTGRALRDRLAADALGLGSIWIHRAREEFEEADYRHRLKTLGIDGEWEGIGHCAIGYIDGALPAPTPRKPGRVYYAG